jgi:hypothetical protein
MKLGVQWQNRQPWASALPGMGFEIDKQINPSAGPDPNPGGIKILRWHTDDWDRPLIAQGRAGAEIYMARMLPQWEPFKGWARTWFELPNEPDCNSEGAIDPLNAFTVRCVEIADANGYHVAGLIFPEGSVHNNGTGDEGIVKSKLRRYGPAFTALASGGHLWGPHIYWCRPLYGPLDRWHSLGKIKSMQGYLAEMGIPCPKVLLGEAGVDGGIIGIGQTGWQVLGDGKDGDPTRTLLTYAEDVVALYQAIFWDDTIIGFVLFVAGYNSPWGSFDHKQSDMQYIANTCLSWPQLTYPLPETATITQHFGENPASYSPEFAGHPGLDFSCVVGTRVLAPIDGTCVVGWNSKRGNYVEVHAKDGSCYTVENHLSKATVGSGTYVARGEQVGLSGNTGNSTGPHLDLELVWVGHAKPGFGAYCDPEPHILWIGEKPMATTTPETLRTLFWPLAPTGYDYHPDWAFPKYAREQGLGKPLSGEIHNIDADGVRLAAQAFALGIVYAPEGQWDKVTHCTW